MKLIPVTEIGYANQGIEIPKHGPYWEYPSEWDDFHTKTYKKAGFTDKFKPFEPGSSFYETDIISDDNLKKLVLDRTEGIRNGEFDRDQACPFDGGYILVVNDEKLFYPQCCGDLGDIQFWRNISNGKKSYYEGHPAPVVNFQFGTIIFDLNRQEFDEGFTPIPKKRTFKIKQADLKKAILETELILEKFGKRIRDLNISENMNLNRIEDLLIWENLNYQ